MQNDNISEQVVKWHPFSLTYVTYIEGNLVSQILAVSSLAPLAIIVSYCTLILFRRDLCTIFAFIGQLFNELLNLTIKYIAKDPRPTIVGIPNGTFFGKYGFPSNHAQFIFFFASFVSLLFLLRFKQNENYSMKYWRIIYNIACWLMAFMISYGRIYLGQHTPGQVIWGSLIGIGFGICWFFLLNHTLTSYFPILASLRICEWLLIRDTTLIPDIVFYEYMCAKSESRARLKKQSLKSKAG